MFRTEKVLPLHQRGELVWVQRTYFFCAKCGREQRFSWFSAYCNEAGELLCYGCHGYRSMPATRLCRRCRQPRRWDQFGGGLQLPCDSSICHDCKRAKPPTKEPLQVTCSRCGDPFTAKRADAKFCSTRCRTAAHRAAQSGRCNDKQPNYAEGHMQ